MLDKKQLRLTKCVNLSNPKRAQTVWMPKMITEVSPFKKNNLIRILVLIIMGMYVSSMSSLDSK